MQSILLDWASYFFLQSDKPVLTSDPNAAKTFMREMQYNNIGTIQNAPNCMIKTMKNKQKPFI